MQLAGKIFKYKKSLLCVGHMPVWKAKWVRGEHTQVSPVPTQFLRRENLGWGELLGNGAAPSPPFQGEIRTISGSAPLHVPPLWPIFILHS